MKYIIVDERRFHIAYTNTYFKAEHIIKIANADFVRRGVSSRYFIGIKTYDGSYTYE